MKKPMRFCFQAVRVVLGLVAACLMAGFLQAGEPSGEMQQLCNQAIESFKKADSGMTNLFANSAGYVVFPRVGKGGFFFGGAHGNGFVFEKGKPVGRASITQFTVGAQIGGQEFAEVIFFETPETLAEFKTSRFTLNAQVSAVAAAEGISKNAKYIDGVLVFTQARQGLMAEASVGGQKFKYRPGF